MLSGIESKEVLLLFEEKKVLYRWFRCPPFVLAGPGTSLTLMGEIGLYPACVSFDPQTLASWQTTPEIEIETSRGEGAPVHRTVIWIVVDRDSVYVRSVRGSAGRWYRELQTNPRGAVHANGQRVAVEAQAAADEQTVARVDDLLREKYERRWPGPTASMLRAEVLPTTLRLIPG